IRKRVNQHFTSTTAKNKRLQKEVAKVSFALTGNLLIAKLKEDDDIKNIKPKYTRRSRKALFPYHLVQQKDSDGYIRLKVEKTDLRKRSLMTFKSLTVAQNNLKRISKEFGLCFKKNGIDNGESTITESLEVDEYNARVQDFFDEYVYKQQTQLLIDKGREVGERSVIFMEEGIYKGYGFYSLNYQITERSILEKILVTPKNDRYARHIIDDYLMESNVKKTLPIKTDEFSQ